MCNVECFKCLVVTIWCYFCNDAPFFSNGLWIYKIENIWIVRLWTVPGKIFEGISVTIHSAVPDQCGDFLECFWVRERYFCFLPGLAGPAGRPPGAADQARHQDDGDRQGDQTDGDLRQAQGGQAGSLWGRKGQRWVKSLHWQISTISIALTCFCQLYLSNNYYNYWWINIKK